MQVKKIKNIGKVLPDSSIRLSVLLCRSADRIMEEGGGDLYEEVIVVLVVYRYLTTQ